MPKFTPAYATTALLLLLQLGPVVLDRAASRAFGANEAQSANGVKEAQSANGASKAKPAEMGAPHPVLGFFTIYAFPTASNSDAPTFVMYSDGTVIFRDDATSTQTENRFLTTTLTPKEQSQLLDSLAPLNTANATYDLSRRTCQPNNILSINTGKMKKRIRVSGILDTPYNPKAPDERKILPPPLISTTDRLRHFKHKNAKPWLPEYVQVRLRALPNAKDEAKAWPSDLPDLNDERTQKLDTDEYSILVPISRYDQLQALKTDQSARMAVVLLHGKKYIATYRMPFPQEKAFETMKYQ